MGSSVLGLPVFVSGYWSLHLGQRADMALGQVQSQHGAAVPSWGCLELLQKLKVKWAAATSLVKRCWHGDMWVLALAGGPWAAGG